MDPDQRRYASAHEEQFGLDVDTKAQIMAHPLFEELLAAHVACLRVGTPIEAQPAIDEALAMQHCIAAKYLALFSVSHQSAADNRGLNHFMVNYILLLQSFKDQILEHLHTIASEAICSFQEIEQELSNLTGVSTSTYQRAFSTMTQQDEIFDGDFGIHQLCLNNFNPFYVQKGLRDHLRRELKKDLKEDYQKKLKEVHDEILQKRRARKLPKDTLQVLNDWLIAHDKWPYPTEEEKTILMEETTLDLKQLNNWFSNQRKRQLEHSNS